MTSPSRQILKPFCLASLAALSLSFAPTLWAQNNEPLKASASVVELAMYTGADRQARLIAGAKKEGPLTVYHVYPALSKVMAAFTQKYDIKTKAWRAGSEAVLQRVIAEARANKFEVDIVQNNAPENEAASREKLLQEVRSVFHQDLIPQAVPAHKEWAGITVDVWTAAYNTNKIKKEDLPKTYDDLLAPKWKGQLGIEGNNHAWFGALMAQMGEDKGLALFNNLAANNGISVRKGHSLLTMLVSSGEVPLALTVYSWNPEQIKSKGAPVEGLALQPLLAQPSTIAMLKKSPNPHAALLFYEFLLSDGQKLLAEDKFVPASKKIENPFSQTAVRYIDPGVAIDMQAKWTKMFEDTVTKRAK
jgi:iron(III) transport system substrate-binding protein